MYDEIMSKKKNLIFVCPFSGIFVTLTGEKGGIFFVPGNVEPLPVMFVVSREI